MSHHNHSLTSSGWTASSTSNPLRSGETDLEKNPRVDASALNSSSEGEVYGTQNQIYARDVVQPSSRYVFTPSSNTGHTPIRSMPGSYSDVRDDLATTAIQGSHAASDRPMDVSGMGERYPTQYSSYHTPQILPTYYTPASATTYTADYPTTSMMQSQTQSSHPSTQIAPRTAALPQRFPVVVPAPLNAAIPQSHPVKPHAPLQLPLTQQYFPHLPPRSQTTMAPMAQAARLPSVTPHELMPQTALEATVPTELPDYDSELAEAVALDIPETTLGYHQAQEFHPSTSLNPHLDTLGTHALQQNFSLPADVHFPVHSASDIHTEVDMNGIRYHPQNLVHPGAQSSTQYPDAGNIYLGHGHIRPDDVCIDIQPQHWTAEPSLHSARDYASGSLAQSALAVPEPMAVPASLAYSEYTSPDLRWTATQADHEEFDGEYAPGTGYLRRFSMPFEQPPDELSTREAGYFADPTLHLQPMRTREALDSALYSELDPPPKQPQAHSIPPLSVQGMSRPDTHRSSTWEDAHFSPSRETDANQRIVRCLLLGHSSKNNLVQRFVSRATQVDSETDTTPGGTATNPTDSQYGPSPTTQKDEASDGDNFLNLISAAVDIDGARVRMELVDTSAAKRGVGRRLRLEALPMADVVIICCSTSDRTSVREVQRRWLVELAQRGACPLLPVIVVVFHEASHEMHANPSAVIQAAPPSAMPATVMDPSFAVPAKCSGTCGGNQSSTKEVSDTYPTVAPCGGQSTYNQDIVSALELDEAMEHWVSWLNLEANKLARRRTHTRLKLKTLILSQLRTRLLQIPSSTRLRLFSLEDTKSPNSQPDTESGPSSARSTSTNTTNTTTDQQSHYFCPLKCLCHAAIKARADSTSVAKLGTKLERALNDALRIERQHYRMLEKECGLGDHGNSLPSAGEVFLATVGPEIGQEFIFASAIAAGDPEYSKLPALATSTLLRGRVLELKRHRTRELQAQRLAKLRQASAEQGAASEGGSDRVRQDAGSRSFTADHTSSQRPRKFADTHKLRTDFDLPPAHEILDTESNADNATESEDVESELATDQEYEDMGDVYSDGASSDDWPDRSPEFGTEDDEDIVLEGLETDEISLSQHARGGDNASAELGEEDEGQTSGDFDENADLRGVPGDEYTHAQDKPSRGSTRSYCTSQGAVQPSSASRSFGLSHSNMNMEMESVVDTTDVDEDDICTSSLDPSGISPAITGQSKALSCHDSMANISEVDEPPPPGTDLGAASAQVESIELDESCDLDFGLDMEVLDANNGGGVGPCLLRACRLPKLLTSDFKPPHLKPLLSSQRDEDAGGGGGTNTNTKKPFLAVSSIPLPVRLVIAQAKVIVTGSEIMTAKPPPAPVRPFRRVDVCLTDIGEVREAFEQALRHGIMFQELRLSLNKMRRHLVAEYRKAVLDDTWEPPCTHRSFFKAAKASAPEHRKRKGSGATEADSVPDDEDDSDDRRCCTIA